MFKSKQGKNPIKNMKPFLPTLFLITFLWGCSSVSINDSSKRNENWCWFVNKATGQGEWVPVKDETNLPDGDYTLFYKDGKVYQTGKLKDKKDCDTLVYFRPDGKLMYKGFNQPNSKLKLFRADGKYVSYYQTGEVMERGEYKKNEWIGLNTLYYKSGKIECKTITNGDSMLGMLYYESGHMKDSSFAINMKKEGLSKGWYENGKLKAAVQYSNGKENGHCIWYFENGNLQATDDYQNGLRDGFSKDWHENGKLKATLHYSNGKEDGLCMWYYENGNLKETDYYQNGIRNGKCILYHESSAIKAQAEMINGKEEGIIFFYYKDGAIKSKENMSNGLKNGEAWYYHPNGKLSQHAFSRNGSAVSYKSYNEDGKLINERNENGFTDYEKEKKD